MLLYAMMKANIPLPAALRVLHHQQKAADGSVCLLVLWRGRKEKRFCDILFSIRFLFPENCVKENISHVEISFPTGYVSI